MATSNHSTDLAVGLGFVVLVGIVLLIFYFVTLRGNNLGPTPNNVTSNTPSLQTPTANTPNTTVTTPTKPTPKPVVKTGKPSPSAPKQYVVDATKFKASGYFIQLYPGCQASPGSLNVKKGSQIMFDNRNDKGHTIAYKGVNHWLAAYGYAVLRFDTVGDNYVTCDGGGSAKVTVFP